MTLTEERALREAGRAEAELRAGHDRGPLHGIPYGAKDLLATAGIPTTWGAAPLRDQVFDYDAPVIERLEQAGAVLVAKLAMVELAGGMGYEQPDASFTGPGRNPWQPESWSGGSSSGSGAAVSARLLPFALGSETVGSIVSPSAYCGVTGLRPTYGRVSRHGSMVLSWTLDKLGPLARSAEDCGVVLSAIAGADARDPASVHRRFDWPPRSRKASGFRLGVLRDTLEHAQPEVVANFERALTVFGEVATLEPVALPEFPYQAVVTTILGSEAAAFDDFLAAGHGAQLTAPEDRVLPYAYETISARAYLRAQRLRRQIRDALAELCAGYDALLSPTVPTVAPPIDANFRTLPARASNPLTAAANLAGLPAVTVPNGFGERGLPTALQFTGGAWSEARLLEVAHAYQQRTDWHQQSPPPAPRPR